jgi:peptide/nickel transport system substrate-binding protein
MKILIPSLFACSLSLVPFWGRGFSPQEKGPRPHWKDQGDTLIVAVSGDADGFLPIVNEQATAGAIMSLIMPAPTDSAFDGKIIPLPSAAQSWDWDKTHTKLTYHFRKDLKWTDGEPLTAEDMAFAYKLYGDPEVASPRQSFLERMDPKKPFELLDPYTIRFNFLWPYNEQTMMAHAGLNLVPKHILKSADKKRLLYHPLHTSKPIGHGPFRLLKWVHNERIVISRWRGVKTTPVPYIKRIIFKILPEYQTQLKELETGKIDMMETVQEKDLAKIHTWKNVKVYERGFRFFDYVAWNTKHPLFKDRRVRRALTMAIDIDGLIQALLSFDGKVFGTKAYSTFTPELKEFYDPNFQFLPFDSKKAKAELVSLGWKDSDGDGILDKDGKKFEFTLVTNSGNPRRADAVQIIQQDLAKIGVKANLESREPVTFFADLRKKKFEAALAGWSAGLFPDPSDIWQTPDAQHPRLFNFTSYSNAEADKLINQGLHTADPVKEAEIWKKVQKIIYEDQPYTFLYWKSAHFAVHKRFRDVKPNVLSVLYRVWDWWVPKAEHKVKY